MQLMANFLELIIPSCIVCNPVYNSHNNSTMLSLLQKLINLILIEHSLDFSKDREYFFIQIIFGLMILLYDQQRSSSSSSISD